MKTSDDFWTIVAMERYGGSFAKGIAQAARHADGDNYPRLKAAFPELWDKYRPFGRTLREEDTRIENMLRTKEAA